MNIRKRKTHSSVPQFGGDWTSAKLRVLEGYLRGYTQALKNQPFRKGYIDAFAGSGYREERKKAAENSQPELQFPDLAEQESQDLLEGSARIALGIEPRFDKFLFIEKRAERCRKLNELKAEFREYARDIIVRQGDANEEIQKFCGAVNWRRNRAVLFLDPYGMQVTWATIEAIASTQAIDLWLLFPLGIGVNRLLKKSGDIPESWVNRLNQLLGTETWYDEFYKVERVPTLFDSGHEHVKKASMEVIGKYVNDRLRSIFADVVDEPGVLSNSKNNPMFLLCFAVGNERGAPIAKRIATSLLKGLR